MACPYGFESECWIVDDRWFVKVWHDDAHPVELALLDRLADRGLPVPRPLGSEVVRTDDGRRFAAFPYVAGRQATGDDWAAAARMLRRMHDLPLEGIELSPWTPSDEPFVELRSRLDHPWITDRADELTPWLDRFDAILDRARATHVPAVLSHNDFGGQNLIIDNIGNVAAIVDWDRATLGPREHDLWLVIDETHPHEFLRAYDIAGLDLNAAHLEYGLLQRALADLTARVVEEVDRPGLTTWGFDRLARVDETLTIFA